MPTSARRRAEFRPHLLDLLEHHARDVARNDQDDIDELHQILKRHLDDLSPAQGEILVESFFEEGKRADIAARRGMTESTYDDHRQTAFKALRESLAVDVEVSAAIDRSIWYDHLEELIERRVVRLRGCSSSKKGKCLNSEGKRRYARGERPYARGERRNVNLVECHFTSTAALCTHRASRID